MAEKPGIDALRRIAAAKAAVVSALHAACVSYANGATGEGAPIVDARFSGEGNARFTPLRPATIRQKQRMGSGLRAAMKAKGRVVSRLVPSSAGKVLPILVRSGLLRQRVSRGKRHRIMVGKHGLQATIWFTGLPKYAAYHHTGAGRLPMRSPVSPNAADRARFVAIIQRRFRAMMGRGSRTVGAPRTSADMGQNNTPRLA
jgi:hypothetical protein